MTETDPLASFSQPLVEGRMVRGGSSTRAGFDVRVPRPRATRGGSGRTWTSPYISQLLAIDSGASVTAGLATYLIALRQGGDSPDVWLASCLLLLPPAWLLAVALVRGYETRFLAVGSEEFRRICVAGSSVLALVGTLAWAFELPVTRRFVVFALLVTLAITLIGRYVLRCSLHRQRARGHRTSRVLLVGHGSALITLVGILARARYHGMNVVAACVPRSESASDLSRAGVRVRGSLDDVIDVAQAERVDAVVVVSCPELGGSALRRIGWALERSGTELLVAPGVVEAVGPRIAVRPVCGVPLLHVGEPELRGVRRFLKGVFDRVAASTALCLLAPLFAALALAVRLDSRGPAFYPHTRVGRGGREFTMYKFRSMTKDADAAVAQLRDHDAGNEMLFKMRCDPRVTRVGQFMRKYSLDELPQLINVALGQMSLVGPRPALPREVARYHDDARRRLLVKPGITGLWQINGRSDLDWEESVRLDLRYVENWSFAFDLMILGKTASAVVRGRGAY